MCRGSSQDFKDSIMDKHLVATVAPFEIFSVCGSNELTVPNGLGEVEADLVPPHDAFSTVVVSSGIDRPDNAPPRRCSTPFTAPLPRRRRSPRRCRSRVAAPDADPAGAAVCYFLAGVLIAGTTVCGLRIACRLHPAAGPRRPAIRAAGSSSPQPRHLTRPPRRRWPAELLAPSTSVDESGLSSARLLVLRRFAEPR
ncbi:hypothetical protein Scep_015246 [Stephania cephalantha]|uniref:Uncharacterized protein n=1 Tax=Stephania cephalantha TaxID=152367 RepID=A0AAP0P2M1_9MAGN